MHRFRYAPLRRRWAVLRRLGSSGRRAVADREQGRKDQHQDRVPRATADRRDDRPSGSGQSTNLYLRRFRILLVGKVSDKWTYFFETDSPNLGKGTGSTGVKDTGSIYIQDAFFTYNHNDAFKVDAGMILLPLSHNNEQSAASLLPVDYGPGPFVESGPLGERVGRDYGVQLRGYPFKTKFEYRLGVLRGAREASRRATRSASPAGRRGIPFAAETGFFYGGHVPRRAGGSWAIGAGFDTQEEYHTVRGGRVRRAAVQRGASTGVSAQVNWMRLRRRDVPDDVAEAGRDRLAEAGFHLRRTAETLAAGAVLAEDVRQPC